MKDIHLRGGSSLKEIENSVFNMSTHNWLLNELWYKIPKKVILSLTKVKLTVGGWRHGFGQVSRRISFYSSFFSFFFFWAGVYYCRYLNVCYFCYLKFNVFEKHRGKYAKPDFVKFISLEMNYFVGTGYFVFKKYRHTFLSGK